MLSKLASASSIFFGLSIPISAFFSVFHLCPKYNIKKMMGYTVGTLSLTAAAYGAHWWYLAKHPPQSLSSWFLLDGGLKSSGAIVGGLLAVFICSLYYKIPILIGTAMALEAGVVALWVVRIGCSLSADHLGQPTRFFMASTDTFGVFRHNLGLYEWIFLSLTLLPFVLLTSNKKPDARLTVLVIVLSYISFKVSLIFIS